MIRTLFWTFLFFLIVAIIPYWYFTVYLKDTSLKKVYIFKNLVGPKIPSVVATPHLPRLANYSEGYDSRLAIYVTDKNSDWLGLAYGLKSIGIPFIITKNYQVALRHKVIFAYPSLENIPSGAVEKLASFPSQGGTLIAQAVVNPELFETFGFKTFQKAPDNLGRLHFDTNFPVTNQFTEPEEKTINIGDNYHFTTAQLIYKGLSEPPLADYGNGQGGAIVQKNYPETNGHAYALGLDMGQLLSVGYNNKQSISEGHAISETYSNHYTPYLDVLLHLIESIYLQRQTDGVTLSTVPYGKAMSLILSHDACFSQAYEGMPAYVDVEVKHGFKATYFIQTKYVTDEMDFAFFTEKNLPVLQNLVDKGMELGSHSVSHSIDFVNFPMGTGREEYPEYQPDVIAMKGQGRPSAKGEIPNTKTIGGTILGELRVSRFLIQHFFPANKTVSFRPGYLKYPPGLPQALTATGYLYSSSSTANDSLTHLPFKLFYNRDYEQPRQKEEDQFQFPITVEDTTIPELLDSLPQSLELAKKISHLGGLYLLSVHPLVDENRVKFIDLFLTQIGSHVSSIWTGTLAEYGKWWAARDQIEIDVFDNDKDKLAIAAYNKVNKEEQPVNSEEKLPMSGLDLNQVKANTNQSLKRRITVKVKAPLPISGLTLRIPANLKFQSSSPKLAIRQDGNFLIIEQAIGGNVSLILESK